MISNFKNEVLSSLGKDHVILALCAMWYAAWGAGGRVQGATRRNKNKAQRTTHRDERTDLAIQMLAMLDYCYPCNSFRPLHIEHAKYPTKHQCTLARHFVLSMQPKSTTSLLLSYDVFLVHLN